MHYMFICLSDHILRRLVISKAENCQKMEAKKMETKHNSTYAV